jgi:hypothetical protein
MTYEEKLQDDRWQEKRQSILDKSQKGYLREFKIDNSALLDPVYLVNQSDPRFHKPSVICEIIFHDSNFRQHNAKIYVDENYWDKEQINQLKNAKVYHSKSEEAETGFLIQGLRKNPGNKWLYTRNLHVHHTVYYQGKEPWEYPDELLESLCWKCHEDVHSDNEIPILDSSGNVVGKYTYCKRCHGAGWFPEYKHVRGGVCFRCEGARYEELIS